MKKGRALDLKIIFKFIFHCQDNVCSGVRGLKAGSGGRRMNGEDS